MGVTPGRAAIKARSAQFRFGDAAAADAASDPGIASPPSAELPEPITSETSQQTDLEQPVDKQAAAQFNLLVEGVIERVANADVRPAWKPNSFFRRYASN